MDSPELSRPGRPVRRRLRLLGLAASGAGLLLTGISSGSAGAATLVSRRPVPAGRVPSGISKMICVKKTQREIAEVLGVKASVSSPTWTNHAYSCRYRYSDGNFVLTVKELSSWPQTLNYFSTLGREQGHAAKVPNLGQGAFQTNNGSAIVRKDWKILTVNISGLPTRFGKPSTSRGDVAVTVADVVLACWAGD